MIDYFFAQYKDYSTLMVSLELIAIFFGLASVWFAKKDNILVFPTGLVSTSIYAYLLWQWELLGDSMINVYYFVMSLYGWYHWTRKKGDEVEFPISRTTNKDKIYGLFIFFCDFRDEFGKPAIRQRIEEHQHKGQRKGKADSTVIAWEGVIG